MEADNIDGKKEPKRLPVWACIPLFIVVLFIFIGLYGTLVSGGLSLVLGVEARHPGVQAADTISAARPGARRETLDTYTNRLKQLEDISNGFKGVEKSFAIQAGREIRIMVVPEQISDADMVLLARNIAKQIESELEYPGQIKVNVIRESRVTDFAK